MKNFWKYFTITILLLAGLFCIGVLYLFFIPGASLFGITYISYNQDNYSTAFDISETSQYASLNTIYLKSQNFQVKVVPANSSSVSVKVHNGMFGFALKRNSKLVLSETVEGGLLTFTVDEPYGAAIPSSSYIELRVPAEFQLDLILENSGAETSLNAENLTLVNLGYTTRSGNFKFETGSISGVMDLNIGRSTFSIASGVQTNTNDVYLNMTSGYFNCAEKEFNTLSIIGSTSGVVRAKACEYLKGNNPNAGGSITVDKVYEADLYAGDTNVRINEVETASIALYKSGSIDIGKNNSYVNLSTNSGHINVGVSNYEVTAITESGDITISDAFSGVGAYTTNGDINIRFDDDADHFIDYKDDAERHNYRKVQATVKGRSSVTIYGVENLDLSIEDGSVNVYMYNVLGDNVIVNNKASVYVHIKEVAKQEAENGWAHYKLSTKSSAGNVSVNLSQTNPQAQGGYRHSSGEVVNEINPNDVRVKDNSLSITTKSGSIKVRDTLTINY